MKLSYLFIVFFAIPFALCAQAKDNQTKRNNILFIIADDWGKHAKSYGTGGWINMPTFDRVASEGILFNNCFTSNPKCAPCRASITTGRNTWQLKEGIQHFGPWPKEFVTYPDILEENGYYVGYTGKGWGPGDYKSAGRKNNPAGKAYNKFKTTAPAKYIHTNDYSRNFIEHFMKNRPKGKPFCFWIGFFEPHRPYEDGVGERSGKSLKSVEVPKYYPNHDIVRGDMLDYAYEAEYMDSHVKKVLDYLKDIGELDNTLIVYTSDHGMPFPRVKGQIYEHGYNVPLAIRWGKNIPKPRAENTFVNVRDFAPTFLELAGVEKHPQMTGKSFLSLLKEENPKSPSDQFMLVGKERHDLGRPNNAGYPVRAIRTEKFLLVHNYEPESWPVGTPETSFRNCDNGPTKTLLLSNFDKYYNWSFGKRPEYQLFDIENDPECLDNLISNPKYANIADELKKRLQNELEKDGDFRALGRDTSWLNKVPWTAAKEAGTWQKWLDNSVNK